MSTFVSGNIDFNQIKLRFEEPFVSDALNKKFFNTMPRGVYGGFIVAPGTAIREIDIDVSPSGVVTGFNEGCFETIQSW